MERRQVKQWPRSQSAPRKQMPRRTVARCAQDMHRPRNTNRSAANHCVPVLGCWTAGPATPMACPVPGRARTRTCKHDGSVADSAHGQQRAEHNDHPAEPDPFHQRIQIGVNHGLIRIRAAAGIDDVKIAQRARLHGDHRFRDLARQEEAALRDRASSPTCHCERLRAWRARIGNWRSRSDRNSGRRSCMGRCVILRAGAMSCWTSWLKPGQRCR